ncbi:MAG: hypothetical protein N2Z74_01040 [Syntrophales bacterium]|nr:hypothetical protein [Syntrophales bacterium]
MYPGKALDSPVPCPYTTAMTRTGFFTLGVILCWLMVCLPDRGQTAGGIFEPTPFAIRPDLELRKPSLPSGSYHLFTIGSSVVPSDDPAYLFMTGVEEKTSLGNNDGVTYRFRLSFSHSADPTGGRPQPGVATPSTGDHRMKTLQELLRSDTSQNRLQSLGKLIEPQLTLGIEF